MRGESNDGSGKGKSSSENLRRNRKSSNEFDSAFDIDLIKKEISPWRRFVDLFLGWSLAKASYFTTICGLCLAQPIDKKDLNRFRRNGYLRLNFFIRRLSRREVYLLDIKLVVWCCLNLVSYYQQSFRDSGGCRSLVFRRKLKGSRDLLCHIFELEIPEKQHDIVRSCISYFTRTRQWDFEDVVLFVFQRLLIMVTNQELVLSRLIKGIEVCQREGDLEEAQMMAASLALILENLYSENYRYTFTLQKCFSTMLKVYLLNDFETSQSSRVKTGNIKFRIHIKNCIRHFISKTRDNIGLIIIMDSLAEIISDLDVLGDDQADLLEMISYCSQHLDTRLYKQSITPRVLRFLLSYLNSNYRSSAMASQRIWHYLLDRHQNMKYFKEPVYHFKGRSNFSVNVRYSREDVNFFKSISQDFFGGVYKCLNNYTETTNLVSSYTTICLVLLEVPDPIITVNMIHVIIKTQNNIFKNEEEHDLVAKYHIHAVVASVLSLICLIHEEEVNALGKYVQEVVSYRNENSPHLLPPLNPEYKIAKHHRTDYHHQLYFLEEEILYALKQCWLGKRRSE